MFKQHRSECKLSQWKLCLSDRKDDLITKYAMQDRTFASILPQPSGYHDLHSTSPNNCSNLIGASFGLVPLWRLLSAILHPSWTSSSSFWVRAFVTCWLYCWILKDWTYFLAPSSPPFNFREPEPTSCASDRSKLVRKEEGRIIFVYLRVTQAWPTQFMPSVLTLHESTLAWMFSEV